MEKYDVVIVGSGIGGLCCGSILALSGKKVLICEAHSQPGGVAHSFRRHGYTFDFPFLIRYPSSTAKLNCPVAPTLPPPIDLQ